MARIEFKDCETKMDELRGYCRTYFKPENNPYTADELTDDEFNFVSGMNYVLSSIVDEFTHYYCDGAGSLLDQLQAEIVKEAMEEFASRGYGDIAMVMTSFIDGHEEDSNANNQD